MGALPQTDAQFGIADELHQVYVVVRLNCLAPLDRHLLAGVRPDVLRGDDDGFFLLDLQHGLKGKPVVFGIRHICDLQPGAVDRLTEPFIRVVEQGAEDALRLGDP